MTTPGLEIFVDCLYIGSMIQAGPGVVFVLEFGSVATGVERVNTHGDGDNRRDGRNE